MEFLFKNQECVNDRQHLSILFAAQFAESDALDEASKHPGTEFVNRTLLSHEADRQGIVLTEKELSDAQDPLANCSFAGTQLGAALSPVIRRCLGLARTTLGEAKFQERLIEGAKIRKLIFKEMGIPFGMASPKKDEEAQVQAGRKVLLKRLRNEATVKYYEPSPEKTGVTNE